ncbi:hypothetical protein Taro_055782 [Colocasia esculenta]|uniref:Uncharacterized protein n=1 Tax=Colocasia esculenta TaxID=4460 RepID=A0A843XVA8_COLES|nr:hypothetical protein [Colocasia esculenta]
MGCEDETRARSDWEAIAKINYRKALYQACEKAQQDSASEDRNCWKVHGPAWMRREHWEGVRNKLAEEKWIEKSQEAARNRTVKPESKAHTSGSISFGTHKRKMELERSPTFRELFEKMHKGMDSFVSERAYLVAKSYDKNMIEKYVEGMQQPKLDTETWMVATDGLLSATLDMVWS